jgi:hypothetical protein
MSVVRSLTDRSHDHAPHAPTIGNGNGALFEPNF